MLHFKYPDDERDIDKSDDEDKEEGIERSILQLALKWEKQHILHILLLAQLLCIRCCPSAVVIVKSHHSVALHQRYYHYHVIKRVSVGSSKHLSCESIVDIRRGKDTADDQLQD